MLRVAFPQQKQNPQLVLEALALASLVQQWKEVWSEAVLLALILCPTAEKPQEIVKEEEAKSLKGKNEGERSVKFTDPTGLRTYFVNGINNPEDSGPPSYATEFAAKLTERGVKDVRLFGVYNKESGLSGTMEGAGKAMKEMYNEDVYSSALAKTVAEDLKNNPLADGETLNLVGYSGGGQVVLNAAKKLGDTTKLDNVVLIGAPVVTGNDELGITSMPPVDSNAKKITNIFGGFDPLKTISSAWNNVLAGWFGHTDYFTPEHIDTVADDTAKAVKCEN